MKIVFLNAWHAKLKQEMAEFLKQHVADTDVFCFQEVSGDMRDLCANLLVGYKGAFTNKQTGETGGFSQGIYIKSNLQVLDSGTVAEDIPSCGIGQYVHLPLGSGTINICNFHGITGKVDDKLDSPLRLDQSSRLIEFFKDKEGHKVIGGDFNILPQAESIGMFVKNGYRDLIIDYGIKTTRDHYAWDRFPDKKYYSDYVFTDPSLKIVEFTVPNVEVSDHLPMILRVE